MDLQTITRPSIPRVLRFNRFRSNFWAELIGTYCLVFAGTGAAVVNEVTDGSVTSLGIGLVFGLAVVAMIYGTGHVSGAHMNPAVTLGLWASGHQKASDIGPYIGAQLIGAVLASFTLKLAFSGVFTTLGATLPAGTLLQSFLMELVLSYILVLTVIGAATDDRAQRPFSGLAIGAALALGVIVGGPISGGSLNPARSFGPALATGNFGGHWVYWFAPLLGAYLAALSYKALAQTRPNVP